MLKPKIFLSLFVFIVTTFSATIHINAEVNGDFNGNGVLGLEDAIFILQVISGNDDNQSYIGSWGAGHDPYGNPNVEWASFTFYPDRYYIYWESRNGGEVEYGTYSYNSVSKNMTFNPIHDDNVNEGPNGANGNEIKIKINEDAMTLGEGMEAFSIKRVESSDTGFVGSWGSGYAPFGNPKVEWASFTFYPNKYYIYWESRNGGEVEYGSCSYDSVLKMMTFNPIRDDNPNEGPNGTNGNSIKIVVNQDTMTLGDGVEAFSLVRVKP